MQSSHDPDGLQPNAANWSRIGPNRSRTEAHPRYQPKTLAMLAQSFAILGIVVDLVLWLLASLAQPRGLRIECKCEAIASGLRNQNIGAAILTIQLNCEEIAKPRRIVRGSKGLHQNPGKSTNCMKTSPRIAPESASFRNRSGIRVQSTQNCGNAGTVFSWELWCNCRFQAIQGQFCFKPPQRPTDYNQPRIGPLLQAIPDCGTTQSNWIAIGLQN